jgi:hypothetical protein
MLQSPFYRMRFIERSRIAITGKVELNMDHYLSSYIAALTAFMVQVVGRTLPGEVQWVAWVAQGILGTLAIHIWMGRNRRKFERVKARGTQVGLSGLAEQV